MVTSTSTNIFAQTTEDDGYTYDSDDPEEQQEQDEREQEAWEENDRPGEDNNDDDNDDQTDLVFEICSDGTEVETLADCPPEPELIECPDGTFISYGDYCPEIAVVPPTLVPPVTSENSPDLVECGDGTLSTSCPEQTFTCSDGSTVTGDEECPSTGPNPYCHKSEGVICHDVKDYDEETRLYPCNDGTERVDWRDCPDASKSNDDKKCTSEYILNSKNECVLGVDCKKNPLLKECYDNGNGNSDNDNTNVVHKTTVIQSASASATTNAADVSGCKLDGSADGIQQKFDPIKYQACGLYTNGDKAYYDGFLTGCGHVGNTNLICAAVADSNILNMKTQPTQTQTATQPTQAIQPTAVGG